jgi:hypothetical protein
MSVAPIGAANILFLKKVFPIRIGLVKSGYSFVILASPVYLSAYRSFRRRVQNKVIIVSKLDFINFQPCLSGRTMCARLRNNPSIDPPSFSRHPGPISSGKNLRASMT